MSEMRQRRGPGGEASGSGSASSSSGMRGGPEIDTREAEQKLMDAMHSLRKPKTVGLSNGAKKWKDLLEKDPYNVELAYKLGEAYANDEQWAAATNILERSYKKVKDLPDEEQTNYLLMLCEGRFTAEEHRNAADVLEQIIPPHPDDERYKKYNILATQVFCFIGDMTNGLKCFANAIEGEPFENAAAVFVICQPGLWTCGCFDVAHEMIQKMITSEEMQQRFSVLQKLSGMRSELKKKQQEEEDSIFGFTKFTVYTFVVVFVIMMLIMGFIGETRSLASWEEYRKNPPQDPYRRRSQHWQSP